MNEHEHQRADAYLWDGQGPIDLEVVRLERELQPIRWKPQPLRMPTIEEAPSRWIGAVEEQPVPRVGAGSDRDTARWWPALVAGLTVAASVLGVFFAVQHGPLEREDPATAPVPAIDPAGPPRSSPELVDPFTGEQRDEFVAPDQSTGLHPDLKDPFANTPNRLPPSSSDLEDPFDSNPSSPAAPSVPSERDHPQGSPDLMDPFQPQSSDRSPDLADPFNGRSGSKQRNYEKPRERSNDPSPDLKDPFR